MALHPILTRTFFLFGGSVGKVVTAHGVCLLLWLCSVSLALYPTYGLKHQRCDRSIESATNLDPKPQRGDRSIEGKTKIKSAEDGIMASRLMLTRALFLFGGSVGKVVTAHGVCLLLWLCSVSLALYPTYGLKHQRCDRCIGSRTKPTSKPQRGDRCIKSTTNPTPTAIAASISWIWSLSSNSSASSIVRGYGTRSVPTTLVALGFTSALPNLRTGALRDCGTDSGRMDVGGLAAHRIGEG